MKTRKNKNCTTVFIDSFTPSEIKQAVDKCYMLSGITVIKPSKGAMVNYIKANKHLENKVNSKDFTAGEVIYISGVAFKILEVNHMDETICIGNERIILHLLGYEHFIITLHETVYKMLSGGKLLYF